MRNRPEFKKAGLSGCSRITCTKLFFAIHETLRTEDACGYLTNIRIHENYLNGIILQSGGKLKGNYYIITPETCTLIGDTTMKNSGGDDVHFKMLKFPYKILEDVSRNFQIQEQPSSQENVNNLINSTGFYFNDNVEIETEKTEEGLKITRFETRILDNRESD